MRSQQARVAADHGRLAMVDVETRLTATAFPWEKVLELGDDPSTTWVRKDGTPFDPTAGLKASVTIDPTVGRGAFRRGAGDARAHPGRSGQSRRTAQGYPPEINRGDLGGDQGAPVFQPRGDRRD